MGTWGVAKAKAQFSEVLDKAETEGPQLVRRRKQEFVLLTQEEFAKRSAAGKPTTGKELWDALRLPPESRDELDLERPRWKLRKVDL
jgi:prevent-host-death family protein